MLKYDLPASECNEILSIAFIKLHHFACIIHAVRFFFFFLFFVFCFNDREPGGIFFIGAFFAAENFRCIYFISTRIKGGCFSRFAVFASFVRSFYNKLNESWNVFICILLRLFTFKVLFVFKFVASLWNHQLTGKYLYYWKIFYIFNYHLFFCVYTQ